MPALCAIRKAYGTKRGRRVVVGYRGVIGEYVTETQPTITEAHKAGIEFAWAALREDYTPILLTLRGQQSVVFRKPDGWYYSPPRSSDELGPVAKTYGQGSYETVHLAVEHAKSHLAQCVYTPELSLDECQDLIDFGGDNLRGWIAWQRSYEHLRSLGYDDEGARQNVAKFEKSFLLALEAPR